MHNSLGDFEGPGSAWVGAVKHLLNSPNGQSSNVIFSFPIVEKIPERERMACKQIDDALVRINMERTSTVATTIFPIDLYNRVGWPALEAEFHDKFLPLVRRKEKWSGYYFDRMTRRKISDGSTVHPLSDIIKRMDNTDIRNCYELGIFNTELDSSNSPRGGHCMTHLSFKLNGPEKRIDLTAVYRLHYYVPKLLGNLIGLSNLTRFMSQVTGRPAGNLTILSVNAELGSGVGKTKAQAILRACDNSFGRD